MILQELFNKNQALKFEANTDKELKAHATIGGQLYVFVATLSAGVSWDVMFALHDHEDVIHTSITKTGHAEEVMACAVKFISQLIKLKDPNMVHFTAAKYIVSDEDFDKTNDSRAELYTRMVKRMLPSNYTVTIQDAKYKRFFSIKKAK